MPDVNHSVDAHDIEPYHSGSIEACNKFVDEVAGNLPSNVAQSSSNSSTGFGSSLPWPNRPLWRNKYCELLNDDFSIF